MEKLTKNSLRTQLVTWVFLITAFSLPFTSRAEESFTISDIKLMGLERITPGTLFNTLPIQIGDSFDSARGAEIIRALFQTEFFDDVQVERQGDLLIITVVERPTITELNIEGNKDIPTEELLKGLKEIGLATGQVFVPSTLDMLQRDLERQYYSQGKYGVQIKTDVQELPRNRVSINIDVEEGKVARIKEINIIGNEVFDHKHLLSIFSLSTPNLMTIVTSNDMYSRQKLAGDLEALRSFYFDRGYLDFQITSTQVSITPDKKGMYITINVKEGQEYTVNQVQLSGTLIVDSAELVKLVGVRPGDIFSRSKVNETSEAISERLGEEGYAFANVNPVPEINAETAVVDLTFFVDPGKRAYVRRINLSGNSKTIDEVLRREMRQLEGAWFSAASVERSKVRLEKLGFFEEVNVETPQVPGSTDQVDVNFSVVERPSGTISAGLGFSQSSGLILNGTITQNNFMGSGNRVSVSASTSDFATLYSASHTDPYFTVDGVSRSFRVFLRETDSEEANVADYDTNSFGGSVGFGIPITEFDAVGLTAGYENIDIDTNSFTPTEVTDFVTSNGNKFDIFQISGAWSSDSRNKAIFPDRGSYRELSGELAIPGSDAEFYKVSYQQLRYFPLRPYWTLLLDGTLSYGDGYAGTDELPFFENYFAGGNNSVRGFKTNTLGPQTLDPFGDDDPFGGDKLIIGKAELYFPVPFLREQSNSVRLSTFFDAGNVFGPTEDLDVGDLRYSVGLAAVWMSPFGALSVSLATPFNDDKNDETETFQFNIGNAF